jgi:hypothetical protein
MIILFLSQPCTGMVRIYTNYGRPNQTEHLQLVSLRDDKEELEVARITFK